MSTRIRTTLILACMLGLAGIATGTALRVRGADNTPRHPQAPLSPQNASVQACIQRSETNCNPDASANATYVAASPWTQPPSPNAKYISEEQAKTDARAGLPASERGSAPAYAKLMTFAALQATGSSLGNDSQIDSRRMVWVVTVHADVYFSDGPVGEPHLVHVFTDVIDAATREMFEYCNGCDIVKAP
jgi:hypothetical protein